MAPPVREPRPPASSPGGGRHRGPTGRDRRVDRCPDGATPHSATLCGDPCPVCAMGDGSTAPFVRLRRGGADRRSAFLCLAALLLNQHCAARPASRGGTDRRSPFPCLRVAPPGGLGAETCTIPELHFHEGRRVRADPIMGVSPGGGLCAPATSSTGCQQSWLPRLGGGNQLVLGWRRFSLPVESPHREAKNPAGRGRSARPTGPELFRRAAPV